MKPIDITLFLTLFLPLASAVGIAVAIFRQHLAAQLEGGVAKTDDSHDDHSHDAKLTPWENAVSIVSIGAIGIGFLCVLLYICFEGFRLTSGPDRIEADWFNAGVFTARFGIYVDSLSLMMLLVVTGVGTLIHIYSRGYMKGDPGFARYFASLSLFTFSMIGIVVSTNFLQMFIFWELVGVSSYLLIGFWFHRPAAADASKKAFLTNRIGDFGFMLGILIIFGATGILDFNTLRSDFAANPNLLGGLSTIAGILIFMGAMGKSAQFPLHVWLPDAMEGPTPVSALIHAATMVAAGVYMLCRVVFVFDALALEVIAYTGGITCLLAALMAIQQNDIKRILAYSTLSQLGYMVMAVGLNDTADAQGVMAAMFHLTTHAAFKAMLFLGAGAVIVALHHEQEIWKMGGVKKRMPITSRTFLVGTLALSGFPLTSGFFSKDSILALSAPGSHHPDLILFAIGVLVAALTPFYMFRLWFVAFKGGHRSDAAKKAEEAPEIMTWPLRILMIPAIGLGFLPVAETFGFSFGVVGHGSGAPWYELFAKAFEHGVIAPVAGTSAMCVGIYAAFLLYRDAETDPLPNIAGTACKWMSNRFYFDEAYAWLIARTHDSLAKAMQWIDQWIIGGLLVRGVHGGTEVVGRVLRLLQNGNLRHYAFLCAVGSALVVSLSYFYVFAH